MREVNGVFVDADREAELTELYRRLTGDQRSHRRARRAGQADGGADAAAAPRSPDGRPGAGGSRRRAGARRGRGRRSRSTAPTCPTAWTDLDEALAAAAEQRRPELAVDLGGPGATAARPGRRAGPADAAAQRRHHGQGRRGHRVLPLRPVHRPERGRRRPGRVRHRAGRVPRPPGPAAGRPARLDDRRCPPTTPSAARTSAPGSRCWPRSSRSGTGFAEEFLAATASPNRAFGYFLAQTLVGAGPIDAGADARVRREGDA